MRLFGSWQINQHFKNLWVNQGALQKERPGLLQLMRGKLLPALAAALEPLTPAHLAAIAGVELEQVGALAQALLNSITTRQTEMLGNAIY